MVLGVYDGCAVASLPESVVILAAFVLPGADSCVAENAAAANSVYKLAKTARIQTESSF